MSRRSRSLEAQPREEAKCLATAQRLGTEKPQLGQCRAREAGPVQMVPVQLGWFWAGKPTRATLVPELQRHAAVRGHGHRLTLTAPCCRAGARDHARPVEVSERPARTGARGHTRPEERAVARLLQVHYCKQH
jgi:hypothetical protein